MTRTLRLPGHVWLFFGSGMAGVQVHDWQVDVRDHRRCPPLFSARELGAHCGRHSGPFCLRFGRLRRAEAAT